MSRALIRQLLAAAAMAALVPAAAQQPDYGYGAQAPAAGAPSTIPGQRSGGLQVPQVQPPPAAQRRSQRPPPRGSIDWGSGASGSGAAYPQPQPQPPAPAPEAPVAATPAPAAPAPATAMQPASEMARPSSNAPLVPADPAPEAAAIESSAASAPPVLRVQEAAPSPPPAPAPDLGRANAQLSESFRTLDADSAVRVQSNVGATNAVIRGTSTARIKSGSATQVQSEQTIAAPALVCAKNGNTPVINRLRPAQEQGLMPGAALVVQGNCFGSSAGTVRLMLPTPRGRIRAVDAQVLNWENGKLFAQLPADLQNVVPGEATVEVWAADGRRSAAETIAFEPNWALRPLPELPARVRDCQGEFALSRCKANDDSEASPNFSMPKNCRNGGLFTCFGSNAQDPEAPAGESFIFGQHYTQDVIRFRKDKPSPRGRDLYELNLPPYLKPSHCAASVTAFETEPGTQDSSASARFADNNVVVDWSFNRYGERGWLQYQVRCQVWAPIGVVLP